MKYITGVFVFAIFFFCIVTSVKAVTAFPGAEGFGVNTLGGRGGTVYEVTNLNDSGAGSLRACVIATGPRTCVFKVGGSIELTSGLSVRNPFITIAGQTAPGGGITLKPATSNGFTPINIQTHDVIIRYVTSRPGPGGMNNAILIAKNNTPLYNIVIDHGSFSWATDEVFTTWYRVYNSSFQWNIASEGLDCSTHPKGCHSKGLMIGGYKGGEDVAEISGIGTENISLHHNLIAHSNERGPLIQQCGIVQIVNNVTYNPAWTFSHQQSNCIGFTGYVNWIGNYHKKGPDSTSNTDLKVLTPEEEGYPGGSGTRIYSKGNIGPSRPNDTLPESNWLESGSRQYIVSTEAIGPSITTTDALTAYNQVLEDAGNSKALDCNGNWISRRDAIDSRVINDVKNGIGRVIDNPGDVGGWVSIASGTPCTDTDHDGMPNSWENGHNLNPNNISDGNVLASNGYTNLENFINGNSTVEIRTGDINGDGFVNILDYTLLSNVFGTANPQADLNSDGTVNILDFTILSNNFGTF
jgi:pectate lyase